MSMCKYILPSTEVDEAEIPIDFFNDWTTPVQYV